MFKYLQIAQYYKQKHNILKIIPSLVNDNMNNC